MTDENQAKGALSSAKDILSYLNRRLQFSDIDDLRRAVLYLSKSINKQSQVLSEINKILLDDRPEKIQQQEKILEYMQQASENLEAAVDQLAKNIGVTW